MVKNKQFYRGERHLEAHYKLFLSFLMIMLIVIPLVSAFEFDNKKTYDSEIKEFTFKNSLLGIPTTTIGTAKLVSDNHVTLFDDVDYAFEIVVNLNDKYDSAFSKIDFYDYSSLNKKNNQVFILKWYDPILTHEISVNDYGTVCGLNNASGKNCWSAITGTHKEIITGTWVELENYNLPLGETKIRGYYPNLQAGERIEWIPTLFGMELTEWADFGTATLYERYEGADNNDVMNNSQWLAQSLTIGNTGTNENQDIKGVQARIYGGYGATLFNVSVYAVSGQDPTGSALTSATLDITAMGSGYHWINISFTGAETTLSASTQYALVFIGYGGGEGKVLLRGTGAGGYSGGEARMSTDNGASWSSAPSSADNTFEVYGITALLPTETTLNSPADNYYSTDMNIDFNCSASASAETTIHNISLWHNGTGTWELNQTYSSNLSELSYVFSSSARDSLIWNCEASDGLGEDLFAVSNRTVIAGYNVSNVTLIAPSDGVVIPETEVTINCSAVAGEGSGANLTSISLWHNGTGTWHENQTTVISSTPSYVTNWTIGLNEDVTALWSCEACDTNADCIFSYENRSVTVHTGKPLITITSPEFSTDYGVVNTTLYLNWSIVEPYLDSCWYNYNSTNISLTCLDLNTTFVVLERNSSLTFYANDTAGNTGSELYSWSYKIWEYNQSYNDPVVSSSLEDFNITLYYNDTLYTNILGYLTYDNVSTSATQTGTGDGTVFSINNEIPLVSGEEVKEFFWNFTLTNSTGSVFNVLTNPNTQNHTVTGVTLALCNATYSVPYINFTFQDELLGTPANGTFSATFQYWVTGGSADNSASFSYENQTVNMGYDFCVDPNTTSLNVNMNAQYGGEDFSPRTYYLNNATLTNATSEIILYQLNSTDSVKFFITVKDGITPFTDATVTISKLFVGEGVYKTTGIRTTDDDGQFIEYLELDQDYRFTITRDGENFGVIDRTSTCDVAPCEMQLQIEGAGSDLWEGFNEYYAGDVDYTFRYNDSSKEASLIFVDTTGLAQYMRLHIYETNTKNSTVYTVCNDTLFSSSGTITCDMTGESGDFTAQAYISRSPEKKVDIWQFAINLIKDVLGLDGVLIGLFLIITIGLVGSWSPTAGIVLTSFAILMMKILGFVAFGWTTVTLIFVLGIIIMIKVKQ